MARRIDLLCSGDDTLSKDAGRGLKFDRLVDSKLRRGKFVVNTSVEVPIREL